MTEYFDGVLEVTDNKLVSAIKNAKDLDDLLDALRAFQATLEPGEDSQNALAAAGIDLEDLPHPDVLAPWPIKTLELWSWDADRVLVGTGAFTEWRIVDRAEWETGHVVMDRGGSVYFDGRAFDTCEEAVTAGKFIAETERPLGVYVCAANDYTAEEKVEVYEPTLSPETIVASGTYCKPVLERVAEMAVLELADYDYPLRPRKLAEALHVEFPGFTVEVLEDELKQIEAKHEAEWKRIEALQEAERSEAALKRTRMRTSKTKH